MYLWFFAESTAHEGTAPAGALVTPFPFICGKDFLDNWEQADQEQREKCAPPGFDDYWWSEIGYYSPAVCPKGYHVGCSRWDDNQGPAVEATETAVQCVPDGYVCNGMHISMAWSGSGSLTAPMIQVRWAESDLPYLATHPLYPGVTPTKHLELRGATATPTPAPALDLVYRQASFDPDPSATGIFNGSDSSTDSHSGGGLSAGAKAGIGVGVAVGVLLLLGLGGFFIWRYRKQRKQVATQPPPADVPRPDMGELEPGGKFELSGGRDTASPTVVGSELNGSAPVALEGVLAEKDGKSPFPSPPPGTVAGAELDGDDPRQGHAGAYGHVPELHGQDRPPYGELPPESRPAEMDAAQRPIPAVSSISRKQVASPVHEQQQETSPRNLPSSPSESGPDTQVSILPTTMSQTSSPWSAEPPSTWSTEQAPTMPSAQELVALEEQHAQLESRRQRILELEQIERDQAVLQQKMQEMRRGGGTS